MTTDTQMQSGGAVSSTDGLDRDPRFKFFDGLIWAVFNCRESDKRKGRKAVLDKFGVSGWKKVLKINRTGIMAMFKVPPTPETQLYADTVGVAAEARCAKRSNESSSATARNDK